MYMYVYIYDKHWKPRKPSVTHKEWADPRCPNPRVIGPPATRKRCLKRIPSVGDLAFNGFWGAVSPKSW